VGRLRGPTVSISVLSEPAVRRSCWSKGAAVARVGFLDLFLGLVAGAGAGSGTDRRTDHGARGSGHGTADDSAGRATTESARTGSGLVVTFGGLTGHGTGDGTDAATDDRTRGSTDRHPDGRAAKGPGACADGFLAVLFVLRRGAVVIERVVVAQVSIVVSLLCVHVDLLVAGLPDSPATDAERRRATNRMEAPTRAVSHEVGTAVSDA
jgi:hypothetical protein